MLLHGDSGERVGARFTLSSTIQYIWALPLGPRPSGSITTVLYDTKQVLMHLLAHCPFFTPHSFGTLLRICGPPIVPRLHTVYVISPGSVPCLKLGTLAIEIFIRVNP